MKLNTPASIITGLVLLASPGTWAQGIREVRRDPPAARVVRYVATHKLLLVADMVAVGGEMADAASSVRCDNEFPRGCTEANPLEGRHPSTRVTFAMNSGMAAALVASHHVLHRAALTTVPFAAFEVWNVRNTVNVTEGLENARARLISAK
jgi:hypothetical protein